MPALARISVGHRFETLSARGPGFDHIRLIAALTVVFHHAWWGVNDILYRYSHGYMQLGLFAVIIFFSISGFLVVPGLVRSGNVVKFVVNRSLRIFPALVLVVLASMFVLGPLLTKYPLARYFASPELYLYLKNITTLMAHYLPGVEWGVKDVQINGALWTLNIEVGSYALLAAFSIVGLLSRREVMLVVFGVVYLVHIAIALTLWLNAAVPMRLVNFIGLFVYFDAGTCLYLYARKIPFSGFWAAAALVLGVTGLGLGIGAVVLPLCVPYLVVYLGLSDLPGRMPLKHDLSYGVYLIHSPIILMFRTTLGLGAGGLLALLAALVTLPLAYLSWKFVEAPALTRKALLYGWVSRHLPRFAKRWSGGAPRRAETYDLPRDEIEADWATRSEHAFAAALRSEAGGRQSDRGLPTGAELR